MTKGETKADTMERVGTYVDTRLHGANKQESALVAGYSEETARKPSLIEHTKAYALTVTRILSDSADMIDRANQMQRLELEKDTPDPVKAQMWAKLAYFNAQTADILTPKVTIKETTDKDGNRTRSTWGTTGAPLNGSQE